MKSLFLFLSFFGISLNATAFGSSIVDCKSLTIDEYQSIPNIICSKNYILEEFKKNGIYEDAKTLSNIKYEIDLQDHFFELNRCSQDKQCISENHKEFFVPDLTINERNSK